MFLSSAWLTNQRYETQNKRENQVTFGKYVEVFSGGATKFNRQRKTSEEDSVESYTACGMMLINPVDQSFRSTSERMFWLASSS